MQEKGISKDVVSAKYDMMTLCPLTMSLVIFSLKSLPISQSPSSITSLHILHKNNQPI